MEILTNYFFYDFPIEENYLEKHKCNETFANETDIEKIPEKCFYKLKFQELKPSVNLDKLNFITSFSSLSLTLNPKRLFSYKLAILVIVRWHS